MRAHLAFLVGLLLSLAAAPAYAQTADDLPIFDAHLHYNRDQWSVYSVDDILTLLDRAVTHVRVVGRVQEWVQLSISVGRASGG